LQQPPTGRGWLGARLMGRPPSAHEALFWLDRHGPDFTLFLLRVYFHLSGLEFSFILYLVINVDAQAFEWYEIPVALVVLVSTVTIDMRFLFSIVTSHVITTGTNMLKKPDVVTKTQDKMQAKLKATEEAEEQRHLRQQVQQMASELKLQEGVEAVVGGGQRAQLKEAFDAYAATRHFACLKGDIPEDTGDVVALPASWHRAVVITAGGLEDQLLPSGAFEDSPEGVFTQHDILAYFDYVAARKTRAAEELGEYISRCQNRSGSGSPDNVSPKARENGSGAVEMCSLAQAPVVNI